MNENVNTFQTESGSGRESRLGRCRLRKGMIEKNS